jgi:hypothetical protein
MDFPAQNRKLGWTVTSGDLKFGKNLLRGWSFAVIKNTDYGPY